MKITTTYTTMEIFAKSYNGDMKRRINDKKMKLLSSYLFCELLNDLVDPSKKSKSNDST